MYQVGVIAEYNPFHLGHHYQIRAARQKAAEYYHVSAEEVAVVVLMSGDFVQRGEPAVVDKYTRAKMALSGGADVVFELPFLYAVSSAEGFAFGAVLILSLLGVDALCFGSECGDIEALRLTAEFLANEPQHYRSLLQRYLSEGLSFPKAREYAMCACMPEQAELLKRVLSKPNNLLGVEYLKAVRRTASGLVCFTVERKGQDYADSSVSNAKFLSAAAIRERLKITGGLTEKSLCKIPEPSFQILREALEQYGAIELDDFSVLLCYKIRSILRDDATLLMNYTDVSEQIANRITMLFAREKFDARISVLAQELKTRDITYTRVCRALLHILLDVTPDAFSLQGIYARLLGFGRNGQTALSELKSRTKIPLISKPSAESEVLRNDVYAASVYNDIVYQKYGYRLTDDLRQRVVKI